MLPHIRKFTTTQADLELANGLVIVLRPLLTPEETDVPMYECSCEYGKFHAFADELHRIAPKYSQD